MRQLEDERTLWISRNILPHEIALRQIIRKWRLPFSLDTDDIIQESYAKIAGLRSVSDIISPRSYLFQVARSIFLMHIRRAKLVPIEYAADLEYTLSTGNDLSPEMEASDREQLRHLAHAVAQLPEPGRTAFVMRFINELSHQRIGLRLGLSENAVQKMLAKTLNRLAHQIGRDRLGRASKGEREIGNWYSDDGRAGE